MCRKKLIQFTHEANLLNFWVGNFHVFRLSFCRIGLYLICIWNFKNGSVNVPCCFSELIYLAIKYQAGIGFKKQRISWFLFYFGIYLPGWVVLGWPSKFITKLSSKIFPFFWSFESIFKISAQFCQSYSISVNRIPN